MENKIVLSSLGHTWFFDIDGTLVKHNGYKIDGIDTLLPGVKDFFDQIPKDDIIILVTSRKSEYKELTETFLAQNQIRYDRIIYDLPYGERILVNDDKPSGLSMSVAVGLERDEGLEKEKIVIDNTL